MPDARARALQYVSGLLAEYRVRLKRPNLWMSTVCFYHNRIKDLTHEVALLSTPSPESEQSARRWCLVAGL